MVSETFFVVTAPSGSGKTTLMDRMIKLIPELEFSISATTRPPRGAEKDGVDYYFLTDADFKNRVENDEFVEWEEVYPGKCYGTLKSEIKRIRSEGKIPILDIDVKGAAEIKNQFGDDATVVFIAAPDIETLYTRLRNRQTETEESINERMSRAQMEMGYKNDFDYLVVNDNLDSATRQMIDIFLKEN